jgi:GntR family transcriptional regulator, transcriptional repressor for pyruvate dehydrogenase complex
MWHSRKHGFTGFWCAVRVKVGETEKVESDSKAYLCLVELINGQLEVGQMKVGDKLPTERELSEQLGASRNSIREALKTLECMGVIESVQGSGNYLSGHVERGFSAMLSMMALFKQVSFLEVSELRRAIEVQALSLAIGRIQERELDQIRFIIMQLEQANDVHAAALDRQFHFTVVAASQNQLMTGVMQALSTVFENAISHVLQRFSNEDRVLIQKAHKQIYESLSAHDAVLGIAAIHAHYNRIDALLQDC